MIQEFLRRSGDEPASSLLLFFSGWGGERALFQRTFESFEGDVMIVYDYTSMDFDSTVLQRYASVHIVAWSMGVWVASHLFAAQPRPANLLSATAINGTMRPIDDHEGIIPAVFEGTLAGLQNAETRAVTLTKFRRRMCGTKEGVALFLALCPVRTPEELATELFELKRAIVTLPPPEFMWSRVIIGTNDMIFTPENQRAAWQYRGVEVVEHAEPHYSSALFDTRNLSKII